jgi:hypothetical protein
MDKLAAYIFSEHTAALVVLEVKEDGKSLQETRDASFHFDDEQEGIDQSHELIELLAPNFGLETDHNNTMVLLVHPVSINVPVCLGGLLISKNCSNSLKLAPNRDLSLYSDSDQ